LLREFIAKNGDVCWLNSLSRIRSNIVDRQ